MDITEARRKRQLLTQYVTFKSVFYLSLLIVWAYYYILLYRTTNSIQSLFIEYFIYVVSLSCSYIFASFYVDKLGYLTIFRLSSLLQGIVLIIIVLLIDDLAVLFPVFAVLRGFSRGIYWPADNAYNLKELHGMHRGRIISILQSMALILNIIIPVLAGALITFSGDYRYIFLLSAVLFFSSIFIPFTYNKKTRSAIRSKEVQFILKRPHIGKFAIASGAYAGFLSIFEVLFLIVPFLLLDEEFSVGVLGSAIGVAAALTAWLDSKTTLKQRIQLGFIGYFIYASTTMILGIIWTVPILFMRSVGLAFTNSVATPARDDLDFRVRENLLGDYNDESAIEMNIVVELFYLVGRIMCIGICILLFSIHSMDLVRILLVASPPVFLISYAGYVYLLNKTKT